MSLTLLAESYSNASSSSAGAVPSALYLVLALILVVGLWKLFSKAGRPGWASIIPIYNEYTLLKIAGRPGWWLLLSFIPFVNLWVSLVVGGDIAQRFGRSRLYGNILCGLLGVGYVVIGFDKSTYNPTPNA